MKSNARATPYFSAYPLKAVIKQASESTKTNQTRASRVINSLRVLPMVNPYSTKEKLTIVRIRQPKSILPTDENWFNNYE